MQKEFVLWEKWLAENVRRSTALDKQDNKQPPESADDEKEEKVLSIWPLNMPYGC